MEREMRALNSKINEIDEFLKQSLSSPDKALLCGEEESEQRKKFDKYSKELLDMIKQSGSPTSAEERDIKERALCQFQLFKFADDVRKAEEQTFGLSGHASPEIQKKIDDSRLKYFAALENINVYADKGISKQLDLNSMVYIESHDAEMINDLKSMKNAPIDKQDFTIGKGLGSIETFTKISENEDPIKKGRQIMEALLDDPRSQSMISAYKKAEKSWMCSAMSTSQEIENRLYVTNAYEKELKSIYFVLSKNKDPHFRDAAMEVLMENGIGELVKDYRTFNDPGNKDTKYIMGEMNPFEEKYRQGFEDIYKQNRINLTRNEGLKDFHKFLLDYGDFGTGVTSDVNNTQKQVRPFIENFMSMPEKDQLKAMYMLEHKMYKTNEKVTDEMLEGYTPDANAAKKIMKASNWKFWKRANSSYIYWDKLKKCVDKIYDQKLELDNTPKSIKIRNTAGSVTKLLGVGASCVTGLPVATTGLTAVGSVLGSIQAIEKMKAEKDLNSGFENKMAKADFASNTISSLSTMGYGIAQFVSQNGANFVPKGLAVATNAINTGKSIASIVHSKKNVKKVADLDEEVNSMQKRKDLGKEHEGLLKKLITNTKILKIVNKDKVKIATCETIKNAGNLTSSVLTLTGIGVAAKIPMAICTAGTMIAESKIRTKDTEDVVDAKNYENDEEKEQKIEKTKEKMIARFARLPKYLQKKYVQAVGETVYNKKNIAKQLRQEAVRKSGEVNLIGTKQSYIKEVGTDIYNILKTGAQKIKEKTLTEIDRTFLDLAEKFVKASGGKDVDLEKIAGDSPEMEEMIKNQTISKLTKNMTV